MARTEKRNSRRLGEIARLVFLGTAAAIAGSLALTYLLFFSDALSPLARSATLAILLPALIAPPLLAYIGLKLEELRGQRQTLNRLATYDQATGLVNGTALAAIVDRRIRADEVKDPARGGFLVLRLDNMLDINMKYGFDRGDEALRLTAAAIRASVRESDTVGRLGAAEFGVFLPGASEENAREVGERIRAEIAGIRFAPGGITEPLDVSTGGVVFDRDFGFSEMFRGAEHQLAQHDAKSGLVLANGPSALADVGTTRH